MRPRYSSKEFIVQRITTIASPVDRFICTIANLSVLRAVALLTAIGLAMFFRGVYIEEQSQQQLRAHYGYQAVEEYRSHLSSRNLAFPEYVAAGFRGELEQNGGSDQFAGMAVIYAGSVLVLIAVWSARLTWALQLRYGPVAGARRKYKKHSARV